MQPPTASHELGQVLSSGVLSGCPRSAASLLLCLTLALACTCGDQETTEADEPTRIVDGTGGYQYAIYADNCVKIVKSPRGSPSKPKICSGQAWRAIMAEVSVKVPQRAKKQRKTRQASKKAARPQAVTESAGFADLMNEEIAAKQAGGLGGVTAPPEQPATTIDDVWQTGSSASSPAAGLTGSVREARAPSVMGALPPGVVSAAMGRQMGTFRGCYQKRLDAGSKASGVLGIAFEVGPGGVVMNPEVVRNDVKDAGIAQCVLRVMRRVRLSQSSGGEQSIVTYSLGFSAR